MNTSEQHNNWITVGEVINLVKKPVTAYVDHLMKKFHEKLYRDCQPLGQCTNPGNCLTKKKPNDLCHPCNGWYQNLASSHRNTNTYQIKWRKNCDSSKWPVDAWEVAKFFMSALGDNKSNVQDAESTDLSSLLNVIECVKDVAFGGDRRVDLDLVKDLRSDVRNAWAHAPNQEMSQDELNNIFEIANKFLEDLDKVFSDEEVKKCTEKIKFVQENGLTNIIKTDLKNQVLLRQELCGDVSRITEEIKILKQDQNSDSLTIQVNEKKLKDLEDFTEECSSRMEDFQKWEVDIEGMRAAIKELELAKNDRAAPEGLETKSCLPEKLSTFTGRAKEISKIMSSLVEGRGIVSLIGGPGFGKSTIAVEVSHRLNEEQGIPVIFSYLSTTLTLTEVVRCLCLDVGVQPGLDPKSSLMVWLRNIKCRVVLVLDNIEQLLEDETNLKEFKDFLRLLRKDSNQYLQIITTSRKSFHVADLESECCSVETMDVESSAELLKKLCPQKELHHDDLIKMIELCGHVPLALRLLAFRLKDTVDPAKLIEWLQDTPIEVLQTPDEKVRNTIEKSFEILKIEDQRHFVRLSVLEGNFNREAAQHVTELVEIKTENFLAELVERSLLQRSGGNYCIHLLINSYLTEMEEIAEEKNRAQGLMVEHFLSKCYQLTLLYWSKDGSNAARKAFKEILHHVEKVLKIYKEGSSETNPDSVIVDTLVKSEIYKSSSRYFYHFILHILSPVLVRNFLEFCAKLAKKLKDVVGSEFDFQCLLAHNIRRSIGWKSEEYKERMELVKQIFDQIEKSQQVNSKQKSDFYYNYGRFLQSYSVSEADIFFQKYLEITQNENQTDQEKGEKQTNLENVDQVITLYQSGIVYKGTYKDMEKAADYYDQALTTSKQFLGNHELTLYCYKLLGDIELSKKNNGEALRYYDMAQETNDVLEIIDSDINVLKNRGLCLYYLDRHQEAVEVLRKACVVIEKRFEGNINLKFQVYSHLAMALHKLEPGCPEAAEFAEKALEVSSKLYGKKIINLMKKMNAIIRNVTKQAFKKY